jgi:hypothetical protein
MDIQPGLRLALQRFLPGQDCRKWRTVHRFGVDETIPVLNAAVQMGRVGEQIVWRVVKDDREQQPVMEWTRERGWMELEHA